MDILQVLLEEIGRAFVPQVLRLKLRVFLLKAGITREPYRALSVLFHLSTLATLLIYILVVYPNLRGASSLPVLLIATFLIWLAIHAAAILACIFLIYIYVDMIIYRRTQELESVLDQYLGLVSENMKGGLSVEQAMWQATRSEFGTLSEEIKLISKRVATGEDISEALRELTLKYDSPMMRRSFTLLVESMEAGSGITPLLDRIVMNIKETKLLKQEMAAANTNYIIFVSIIVLFVAPLLFAISNQLLTIFNSFSSQLGGTLQGIQTDMPLNFGSVSITPGDFAAFSRAALFTISACSSMIVSMVSRGDIKGGLKYLPMFVTVSIVVFSLINAVLAHLFSGIFA